MACFRGRYRILKKTHRGVAEGAEKSFYMFSAHILSGLSASNVGWNDVEIVINA